MNYKILSNQRVIKPKYFWSLFVFCSILNGSLYFYSQLNVLEFFVSPSTNHIVANLTEEHRNITATNSRLERIKQNGAKELDEFRMQFDTIPDYYFLDQQQRSNHSGGCVRYPKFTDLYFTNQVWQTFHADTGIIQLLSAFYDNRTHPVVRIVSMINRRQFKSPVVCYLWYDISQQPVMTEMVKFNLIWLRPEVKVRRGVYLTYLITCSIPPQFANLVPDSVSLVNNKCDLPSNNLKIFNERPIDGVKKDFAVCVKAINFGFSDNAINLVEWVELLNILGADLITLYMYRAKDDFVKVTRYYESSGQMKVFNMSVPGQLMPYPMYMYINEKYVEAKFLQLASYQDCFYRNFQKYKYISLVDIDEVILPVNGYTWADMFKEIDDIKNQNLPYAEYVIRHMRFYTDWNTDQSKVMDIPSYVPMLSHITRTEVVDKLNAPKGFFDTRFTVGLHNHWAVKCFARCNKFFVPLNISQMNHYRRNYAEEFNGEAIEDKIIWKYKDKLLPRTTKALINIGLIKKA